METRQFAQLAGLPRRERDGLLVDGLTKIAANVASLATDIAKCGPVGASRAARLAYNAGREEAGKFLILIDIFRAPGADQKALSGHFKRAKKHLAKLLYAQIADYRIADRAELVEALERHRQALYLDGPNDHDYIFRNDLLSEREDALYVDLVQVEGRLEWWNPFDSGLEVVADSMRLVMAIHDCGVISPGGFTALKQAWSDFDPGDKDTHCTEWMQRTRRALASLPAAKEPHGDWTAAASFAIERWPMPMVVDVPLDEAPRSVEEMEVRRSKLEAATNLWD